MSRRRVVCGSAVLLTALFLTSAALADGGSVTGQGYPCATAPPPAPGQAAGGGMCGNSASGSSGINSSQSASQGSGQSPSQSSSQGAAPIAPSVAGNQASQSSGSAGGVLGSAATGSRTGKTFRKTGVGGVLGAQATLTHPAQAGGVRASRTSGTLPFTGLQLAAFALLGTALLAGGMALRTSRRGR